MRHDGKSEIQRELSWFLIAYLMMLLGVLVLVHVLQPEREGVSISSRAPVHQGRPASTKPVVATYHAGGTVAAR